MFSPLSNLHTAYRLEQVAALCNRAELAGATTSRGGSRTALGDASELAILKFIETRFRSVYESRQRFPKVYEEPFNSTKKYQVSHNITLQTKTLVESRQCQVSAYTRCPCTSWRTAATWWL